MKLMAHCNSVPPRPRHAAEVWKSALFPRGSLLHGKAPGHMFFVVKPYKSACLVWPAVRASGNIFRHDLSAQSLEFIFATDLENFEVYTTETWGPMRLHKQDFGTKLNSINSFNKLEPTLFNPCQFYSIRHDSS